MTAHADILTHTAEIEVDHAEPMRAYVARPLDDRLPAGVIVAGELFGISAHVRDVCERLAGLGYTALAPDLHHRTAPMIELPHDAAGRERGMELLQQMTRAQVLDDLAAAMSHLRVHGNDRLGMVGLSVGGHVAYLAATELDLAAVAVLYGGWIPGTDIPLSRPDPTIAGTAGITGRVLFLVGENDHIVPPDHRRAIGEALRAAGVRHELVEYPNAPHGFLCDRRATYDFAAAENTWRRIETLLREELQ